MNGTRRPYRATLLIELDFTQRKRKKTVDDEAAALFLSCAGVKSVLSWTTPRLGEMILAMPKKRVARWKPNTMRGHELRRGSLTGPDGKFLALRITLKEARKSFPEYRVVSDGVRTWDSIDFRVPGSYGSKQ